MEEVIYRPNAFPVIPLPERNAKSTGPYFILIRHFCIQKPLLKIWILPTHCMM